MYCFINMWNLFGSNTKGKFRVIPDGRDGVIYTNGEYSMAITTEMGVGKVPRGISADSISHWLPPHELEVVDDETKRLILQAVLKYWLDLGKRTVIEGTPNWLP